MIQFTIVNATLQIQSGASKILVVPQLYVGVNSLSLYQTEPIVSLFNLAQGTNLTIFEAKLSECTDSNGSAFTVNSFLSFASLYFGAVSLTTNNTGVNGATPYKLISTSSTNANVIKASGGNLYTIVAIGLTSTVRYLKIYNNATSPTVGTDIPLMTIPIPANTQGAGVSIPFSVGVNFPLGISIAITSGSADSDTGKVTAGDVVINLTYA
jgi:hypothetical protein